MDEKIITLLRGLEILEDFNIEESKEYILEGVQKEQFEKVLNEFKNLVESLRTFNVYSNCPSLAAVESNIWAIERNIEVSFSTIQSYIDESKLILEGLLNN